AKDDLTALLEEELGAELKFLAPKLGKALDKYLEKLRTDDSSQEVASLRERLDNSERVSIEREIDQTHTALAKEFFNTDQMPDKVVKAIEKKLEEFPPEDKNMAPATYYRKIFNRVAFDLDIQKPNQRARPGNQQTPASQLSSQSRGVVPTASAKKMTL